MPIAFLYLNPTFIFGEMDIPKALEVVILYVVFSRQNPTDMHGL